MSFEQIESALRGGEEVKVKIESDDQVRAMARDWRAIYGI